MNRARWAAAEKRRRRQNRLTACPIRHYGLPLLCGLHFAKHHGVQSLRVPALGLRPARGFSHANHMSRSSERDKSNQPLLLMKHHQAILSDYGNARSPFWPRMWYSCLGHRGFRPPPGQGCSTPIAGGQGWVQTQHPPPPSQRQCWGKSCSHITSPGLVGPQCCAPTLGPAAPQPVPCNMGYESHTIIL